MLENLKIQLINFYNFVYLIYHGLSTYFTNVYLWITGWSKFDQLQFKDGWGKAKPKWLLLYLLDHGINVIFLAGQVETISRAAQDHRSGWIWDKLLRVIEKFDEDHGPNSGPTLWNSKLPPLWTRIVVPIFWIILLVF